MEYETLIEEIKKQCARKHISPYKLSKLSGVPQSTIYGILRGKNRAQIDTLCELLKALKLKIFLLPKEEMKQMPSREQDYVLNGLSDEKKEVVKQLIRWLADL